MVLFGQVCRMEGYKMQMGEVFIFCDNCLQMFVFVVRDGVRGSLIWGVLFDKWGYKFEFKIKDFFDFL